MANILFMMDFAKGHLLPSFGIAQSLVARGHRVGYAVIPDVEEVVRRHDFEVVRIFSDLYPAGTMARLQGKRAEEQELSDHLEPLIDGSLDQQVETWKPDLIVASFFVSFEALVLHHRYGLPIAIFTPNLRPALLTPAEMALEKLIKMETVGFKLLQMLTSRGHQIRKMRQLLEPLEGFPEFICCPPEFALSRVDRGPHVHYIEPSIRRGREVDGSDGGILKDLPMGKFLIYASLGSEIETYREAGVRFYQQLFEFAKSPQAADLFFIVSLGARFDQSRLGEIPANVRTAHWVPQMAVLERVDAAITHGGLGTVKECIWHGVPMVVLPVGRDQPENAACVQHHRLGRVLAEEEMTVADLANALQAVLEDETVKQAIGRMKDLFRQREEEQASVRLVEEMLLVSSRPLTGTATLTSAHPKQ